MAGRHSKYIISATRDPSRKHVVGLTFDATLVEQSRFGTAELRRLRAERGVGPANRVDADVRAASKPSKRA